jgi:small neutral amino acid transporter SnatA (MarC family)
MERLMGMILVAVSVQMLLTGIHDYWQSLMGA